MNPKFLSTKCQLPRIAPSLVILLWPLLLFANSDSATITAEQCAIEGVTIGSLESELIAAFGAPQETASEHTDDPDFTSTQYILDGVEAYVEYGEVLHLVCHNSKYATPDGVMVGDSIQLVFNIYGETEVELRGSSSFLRYNIEGKDVYLLFQVIDRHVVMIGLFDEST